MVAKPETHWNRHCFGRDLEHKEHFLGVRFSKVQRSPAIYGKLRGSVDVVPALCMHGAL